MTERKPVSQTLRALMGVRELVFAGQISPGERLSEVMLAERLGLSRTPLRAALARLEQEGMVETIPSGGYAVRSFSQADIVDAIELRGLLEGAAARLAAERGLAPARLQAIYQLLSEIDAIVAVPPQDLDIQAYAERNDEFHTILKSVSGSNILAREIERVCRLPFASPSAFVDAQGDSPAFRASLTVAQSHHRAIVNAIELREGARAEAIAREHARLARSNLDFVMENRKALKSVPGLALVAG